MTLTRVMIGPMNDGDACTQVEVFRRLLNFLNRLDAAHIHYALDIPGQSR
jgi:hypothetical protein